MPMDVSSLTQVSGLIILPDSDTPDEGCYHDSEDGHGSEDLSTYLRNRAEAVLDDSFTPSDSISSSPASTSFHGHTGVNYSTCSS